MPDVKQDFFDDGICIKYPNRHSEWWVEVRMEQYPVGVGADSAVFTRLFIWGHSIELHT